MMKVCRNCQLGFQSAPTSRQVYCSAACRMESNIKGFPTIENERWLPIVGYEDRYAISDHGRVKQIHKNMLMKCGKSKGYHNITFWTGDTKTTNTIHKLVALHFLPTSQLPQIRHLDGNKHNNHFLNLAWGTSKENADDRTKHGTLSRGEKHAKAVLTDHKVIEIRRLANNGMGPTQIGKQMGMSKSRVHEVVSRRTWKHLP